MISFFSPCRTMLQVYQNRSGIGFMISITVKGCMDRSGQFRFHLRIGKFNCIITRSSSFLIFREAATISIPCTSTCTRYRHDENVSQVHTSGSIQMCLCKSPCQRIFINIFRTVPPTDCSRHGASLYHSERATGSGKGMPIIGSTNKSINVLSIILDFLLFRWSARIQKQAN